MKTWWRASPRTLAGALICVALSPNAVFGQAPDDWQKAYRVGDLVELHISGPHWQRCTITENSPGMVMRGLCAEYVEAAPGTYRRAGGTYILYKGDFRPYNTTAPRPPRTDPPSSQAGTGAVLGAGFVVGEKVEIEASKHWVPCVVAENSPPSIMRVRCDAYPQLSRNAGIYPVDRDNPAAVRKAGAGGTRSAPSMAKSVPPAATGTGGLKLGEYACYGSGGRILVGLGFKVLPGNRFTDLDGGNSGTYSVNGDIVSFRGGHLGGQTGRELRSYNFRIGAQASCEPF